jgi:glycyl-tRNA synthetase beta subunit
LPALLRQIHHQLRHNSAPLGLAGYLGSLADKSQRVGSLAEFIAKSINTDADQVMRAAKLAKTDLNGS